eukprot:TRINITY_DN6908_c0_g1_i1.p1 TRINITY_DN6908_c0_g1~~TRINITY_DN6908_c0_g1_i1.p1  ORF type:complete len:265 (-),score=16.51 TRINITY_DN6908_c0_g1_i1:7-801(-)
MGDLKRRPKKDSTDDPAVVLALLHWQELNKRGVGRRLFLHEEDALKKRLARLKHQRSPSSSLPGIAPRASFSPQRRAMVGLSEFQDTHLEVDRGSPPLYDDTKFDNKEYPRPTGSYFTPLKEPRLKLNRRVLSLDKELSALVANLRPNLEHQPQRKFVDRTRVATDADDGFRNFGLMVEPTRPVNRKPLTLFELKNSNPSRSGKERKLRPIQRTRFISLNKKNPQAVMDRIPIDAWQDSQDTGFDRIGLTTYLALSQVQDTVID